MSNLVPSWPDDHCAALRKYAEAGLSFSQMAKLINDEFRSSYSRNACIGKAARLGIEGKKHSVKRKSTTGQAVIAARNIVRRKKPPQFSPRIGSFVSTGGNNSGQPIDREVEPAPLRCIEVETLNIPFEELTGETCHWPEGEAPPFTFCGRKTLGSVYCASHQRLSVGRGTISERLATYVSKEAA